MKLKLKNIPIILFSLTLSFLIFYFRDHLSSVGQYGYPGIFLASLLGNATIILPVPTFIAAYLGGGVFNPLLVGLVSSFGATLGESTAYLAGLGGRGLIGDQKKIKQIQDLINKYGLVAIFVLATIPNPLFDIAGATTGLLRIPYWKFFLATALGKFVKFLVLAYLGAGSFIFFANFL